MDIAQAVSTVEYKIATEADSFAAGYTIKIDINNTWPSETDLSDALRRKYPYISVIYDHQPNDRMVLLIVNKR